MGRRRFVVIVMVAKCRVVKEEEDGERDDEVGEIEFSQVRVHQARDVCVCYRQLLDLELPTLIITGEYHDYDGTFQLLQASGSHTHSETYSVQAAFADNPCSNSAGKKITSSQITPDSMSVSADVSSPTGFDYCASAVSVR